LAQASLLATMALDEICGICGEIQLKLRAKLVPFVAKSAVSVEQALLVSLALVEIWLHAGNLVLLVQALRSCLWVRAQPSVSWELVAADPLVPAQPWGNWELVAIWRWFLVVGELVEPHP